MLLPTDSLPKLMFVGVTVIWGWDATPAPVRLMTSGEFGELLTMEMLPVEFPAVVGENFAVNDVLCPAPSVAGVARPLILKPVPDALACEIETLAEPELVKVTDELPLAPTFTFPKLTVDAFAVRLPCVPEPLTGIERVELLAVLEMVIVPDAAPVVVGANCAVKLADWFAPMVTGVAKPITLKPLPVATSDEIVALALPVFVNVIVCWPLLPTATLPNDTFAGLAPRVELVATPMPDIVRVCGEFGALSVKLMLPDAAPVAVGANCAENVTA